MLQTPKPIASQRPGLFDAIVFILAGALNTIAYMSLQPLLLFVIVFALSLLLLSLIPSGGVYERLMFVRAISVYWFAAGVAAVYASLLGDSMQLLSDAGAFYRLASSETKGLSINDVQRAHESALPIVIWRWVYDALFAIGFDRGRFVGVQLNALCVAITGVLAIGAARKIFGDDPARLRLLVLLFSACGLLWLFAGIHVRDAFALLGVTSIIYLWIGFVARPSLGLRLALRIFVSLLAGVPFALIRTEFALLPAFMVAAAGLSLVVSGRYSKSGLSAFVLAALGLAIFAVLAFIFGDEILSVMARENMKYTLFSAETGAGVVDGSLGLTFIVEQPLPLRVVLGSVYLFVFPVPFWAGFQLESAYHLFKSFNAIFFYFFVPLVAVALERLWVQRQTLTPAMFFLLIISVVFVASVAATSIETRHFGAFLAPVFLISLVPDVTAPPVRRRYKTFLLLFLVGIVLVHGIWFILKWF